MMQLKHTKEVTLKYTHELGPTIEAAASTGRGLDYPGPYTAQIDLDSKEELEEFRARLSFFNKLFVVRSVKITKSKSPDHFHVRVEFSTNGNSGNEIKFTPLERIAVQAILGSDYRREIIALARLKAGDEHPSLLFEKINLEEV